MKNYPHRQSEKSKTNPTSINGIERLKAEQSWMKLAQKNNLTLVPFLLKNVGGILSLNQSDGIHPTKAGHKILAKNVWSVLVSPIK